jgi:hypothetical protein
MPALLRRIRSVEHGLEASSIAASLAVAWCSRSTRPPTINVVKAGAAVPVKFSLDGNHGLGIFASGYPASQPMSCDAIRYTERLAEAGIEPSVGSRGDSYDNALAETINGLYKAELIHRRALWKTREAVELATLEWHRYRPCYI